MSDKTLYKSMNFEVKATDDDNVLTFIGSDETVDRYQEVIRADGWQLDTYKQNPVVMLFHNYSSFPVAKATKVWVENSKLMFDIEFVPMEGYNEHGSLADTAKKLYKNGFMSAVSVGLMALEFEYPEDQKSGVHRYITKSELLELSLVPIPANPSALVTSRSIADAMNAGAVDIHEVKELQMALDEMLKKSKEEGFDYEGAVENALLDLRDRAKENPQDFSCDEVCECEDCKAKSMATIYDLLLEIRSEQTKEDSKEEDLIRLLKKIAEKP